MNNRSSIALLLAGLIIVAPRMALARPTPDLYPNSHLKSVSSVQADRDVLDCQVQAEDYERRTGAGKQSSAAGDAARGAVRGAALGALAGTITKAGAGRGAGAGAAVGGLSSAMGSRRERKEIEQSGTPEYRKFVEACLDDKGYKVVGWR